MKFVTNSISLGKPTTFDDIIKKVASQGEQSMKKEASVAEPQVKEAKKKEKDEAESSGQPEAEGKLTNDPKVEKEAAGFMCEKCNKPNFKCECEKGEKKDEKKDAKDEKEAKAAAPKKQASGKNEDEKAESSGQLDVEPLHQKGESVKPSAITDKNKKTEAAQGPKFVKVAKLNGKTRAFLKDYWSRLYPADYAEAMLAEK